MVRVCEAGSAQGAVSLLLSAGAQALHGEGELQASRARFDAAYREAERDGDAAGMAQAVLGMGGLRAHECRGVAQAVLAQSRLRRARAMVEPGSDLELRLRVRLAAEVDYGTGEHEAILAAVSEARRFGDPVALAEALSLAHHCLMGPEHGAVRHTLAGELIAESFRTERRSDLLMGLFWRTADLFLDADVRAERSLAELRTELDRGDHLAVGYLAQVVDVMLAIRAGRLEQAETQAVACAQRGVAAGDPDATGWRTGQLVAVRWYQGRIAELLPALREAVDSPALSAVDNSALAALAVAAAVAGERREAAAALARLCGHDLARLPRSSSWLVTMYGVVEAANLLEDAQTAAAAYRLLVPFARLPMVAGLGAACFGSVEQALGLAALTTGDADAAVRHLRTAVQANLALHHWPAVVLSRSRLADALAVRRGPGDTAQARLERDLAGRDANGMDMAVPDEPARGGRPVVVCRRRGHRWQVDYSSHRVLVEHSVGMQYLAVLLANPGQEIQAVELAAGPGVAGPGVAGLAAVNTAAQPVLDEAARRAYRQRLAALEAEIDEYERRDDVESAERVRAEREWLVAELASAAGLGGRMRSFPTGDERARIAVGKAIRRALKRIATADPAIGEELRTTVQTGLRCSYRP